LNKIDFSSVKKDGKIEAVHDLLEQKQALCLLTIWSAVKYCGKSCGVKHQQMTISYLEYILQQNNGHLKWIFKWYNDVHDVNFSYIWI